MGRRERRTRVDRGEAAAPRYRYCHPCEYQYVPAVSTCTECGRPLVDEPLRAPAAPPGREHGTASIQISGLSTENRELLAMLLRSEEIPAQWASEVVVVPADRTAAASDLIAELGAASSEAVGTETLPRATVAGALRNALISNRTIATRWQRLGGWLVDSIVIGLVGRGLAERAVSWWLIGIAVGLYWIVATAVWGATIGKLVVRTRVTVAGGRPPWRASVVRWAVTGWIGFAAGVSADIGAAAASTIAVLALVTWLATYTPILWDCEARGLHDRLAGTVVVRRHL